MIFGAHELAQRRAALLERCASERRNIATACAPLHDKTAAAERLVTAVRALLPWLTGALTLYTLLRQRKSSG